MVKNTCAICLPAAAGTEIARRFQRIPSRFSPSNKVYSKSAFILSFTKYRPVKLAPIAEYSALLPPKEIGPCLSSDVAVDSLEPTMDQWLGWAFTPPTTLNPGTSHPGADHLLSHLESALLPASRPPGRSRPTTHPCTAHPKTRMDAIRMCQTYFKRSFRARIMTHRDRDVLESTRH